MILSAENVRRWQTRLLDGIVCRSPKLGLDKRAEWFATLFEKHLKSKSQILDLGGRWGFYVEPLRRRGHQITVLDVVRPRLQKAPVVIYDGEHIPFEDKTFDAVLLATVLHHIPDPVRVLKEARRVVKNRLVIIEDLYHHRLGRWWTILRDRFYNFEFFGHPCQFRKADEWRELIEKLGFKFVGEEKVYTRLLGIRILNGIMIFEREDAKSDGG